MSIFTTRHYKAIAEALVECRKQAPGLCLDWLIGELQAMFAKDNPRFDSTEFLKACRSKDHATTTKPSAKA